MRIHEKETQDADLEVALECFRNSWEYDELFHYNSIIIQKKANTRDIILGFPFLICICIAPTLMTTF